MFTNKKIFFTLFLLGLLILAIIFTLSTGVYTFNINDILDLITGTISKDKAQVFYTIRLPHIILAIAVGGALSISGAMLQGTFRNPLVEPYTLGISGGASLGIALALVFRLTTLFGIFTMPIAGFSGALLAVFIVYIISIKKGFFNINNLLLTGVMISFIASSVVMLIMSLVGRDDLHSIIFWIMGRIDISDMRLIMPLLFISLGGLAASYLFALPLNALSLGEDEAFHLGINTDRLKKAIFLLASLLTGLCVSITGIIGFIGLVIPHFIRIFTGNDHRLLFINSWIGGAVFLMVCDSISRIIIAPRHIPVGVITGIIGGLLFIYMTSRGKAKL